MADFIPASNPFSAGDDFPSTAAGVTLPGGVSAVVCDYPHTAEVMFENLISKSYSGKEKRFSKVPRKFKFSLRFEQLLPAEADTLWNHYLAQSGTLNSFTYIDYLSGESFTVRYARESMSRESYVFDAERVGIELIEVL